MWSNRQSTIPISEDGLVTAQDMAREDVWSHERVLSGWAMGNPMQSRSGGSAEER
jgi:hypothetical protein